MKKARNAFGFVLVALASLALVTMLAGDRLLADSREGNDTLQVGDPAPPLEIASWIQGEPVDIHQEDDDTIYVVEFWATWCPPCVITIPHLTELQREYEDKGVVIIGISDEDADTVRPFVEERQDEMQYAVAVDDNRQTMMNWMLAAGATGIPHAFLVDPGGTVVWMGHPMALDDELEALVAKHRDTEEDTEGS